jgi:hypothetical protein
MQVRRQLCRPPCKLLPGHERFELAAHMLRERLNIRGDQAAVWLHRFRGLVKSTAQLLTLFVPWSWGWRVGIC